MDSRASAYAALDSVVDPELDEPITTLGFVRTLAVSADGDVTVHLRLPTAFCAPNFAYLMASDAKTALRQLSWTRRVVVELDDHHDSAIINAGLASEAGYRGTFGPEADDSLDQLRVTFRRKAHTAAMHRALAALLATEPHRTEISLAKVTLGELPECRDTAALRRHRAALGLSTAATAVVVVDDAGRSYPPAVLSAVLRRARATSVAIEGNAHFCRALLRTRYGDDATYGSVSPAPDASPLPKGAL